jgi:hypothetical protein
MHKTSLAFTLATLTTLAGTVAAQPASAPTAEPAVMQTAPAPEKQNSINVSPLGLLFGNLYVTYEKFMDGHGFIVDAGFGRTSGDGGSEAHGAVGVGYRWHWRGRQNSGFLGVMFHQTYGHGEMTYNPGAPDEMSYDMTVRSTMLTGNIGKRWMLGDSLNITLRLGLGLGHHVASADEDTDEAREAEEDMNALLSLLPVGFDGELSVGYNF